MVNIDRLLYKNITNQLFQGKVIILYGARRVGKTTLCKQLLAEYPDSAAYFNCELLTTKQAFETSDIEKLKNNIGDKKLIILDEAQSIEKIGMTLKIMVDEFPDVQVVATGSSSFDLANKTGEPLVGRARTFTMYPLSLQEISTKFNSVEIDAKMENMLKFGMMPSVFDNLESEAREELNEIASRYLYKDILEFEQLKKPSLLVDLLQALALQIGNEVNTQELAKMLKVNHLTIARYIDLLEKTFVIFRLRSFSRNMRKEIAKSFKIYFWDLGLRNSLIQNFNSLDLRSDIGNMWENFCIAERIKKNSYARRFINSYFWRTYNKKEIDYIEEIDGKLSAFEFKLQETKVKPPKDFLESYSNSTFEVITKDNYRPFLM